MSGSSEPKGEENTSAKMLTTDDKNKNQTNAKRTQKYNLIPQVDRQSVNSQPVLKGDQVPVSLKTVVGEAILGPEPTLDFLFYFRFTPVSLSAALMGSTHKFDYVFFLYI